MTEDNQISSAVVDENDGELDKIYNQTVKKVTEDYEALHFNTGISQLMIFVNDAYKAKSLAKEQVEGFIQLIAPIAPHMAEEVWSLLGHEESISYASWPTFDESKLVENTVEIVLQVNGKVRQHSVVSKDATKDELEKLALNDDKIKEELEGKTIRKVIAVPGKLVNIVAN